MLPKFIPGTYIIAVSGGVDSMALLDMLRKDTTIDLVVAHVNHGIRKDAGLDEALVREYAAQHALSYESKKLHLGPEASEAEARNARYEFLRYSRNKYNAHGIIVAHHQDDMVETALLNLERGTGWRGIAPFIHQNDIIRPLLNIKKQQLIAYAHTHNVPWREDSTNASHAYTRNTIRHQHIPLYERHGEEWREEILQLIRKQQHLRRAIQSELQKLHVAVTQRTGDAVVLPRHHLIMLPQAVAIELLQTVFTDILGHSLQRPQIEQILLFAKVAGRGKLMPVNNHWQCRTSLKELIVEPATPVIS